VRAFFVDRGAKLTLACLTVADGSAGATNGLFGGGVLSSGGTLRVDHSTLSNNSASFGGVQNSNGTLKVTNSTFPDNSALKGGGIHNSGGTLDVTNSTLSGNSSTGDPGFGGGIENTMGGTATVTRSTLSNITTDTTCGSGGVIYNSGATLTVINSTLSGNKIGGNHGGSGGIHNNTGTLNVISSTFSNNGILNVGDAALSNTLLAHVSPGNNCVGTVTDDGYNISDDGTFNFTEPTGESNTDPKLASSLTNNSCPTQTIALLKGSPAINAIPKGQNGCDTEIKTDQRGVKRPQGTACDIGSYEKSNKAPPLEPGVEQPFQRSHRPDPSALRVGSCRAGLLVWIQEKGITDHPGELWQISRSKGAEPGSP